MREHSETWGRGTPTGCRTTADYCNVAGSAKADQVEECGKKTRIREPAGMDESEGIAHRGGSVYPRGGCRLRGVFRVSGRSPIGSKDFSRGVGFSPAVGSEPDRRG